MWVPFELDDERLQLSIVVIMLTLNVKLGCRHLMLTLDGNCFEILL